MPTMACVELTPNIIQKVRCVLQFVNPGLQFIPTEVEFGYHFYMSFDRSQVNAAGDLVT